MITQTTRRLRDYQEQAISHTLKALETPEAGYYYTLPTGTGKTRILTGLVERLTPHGRILAIAHRKELIEQMADAIREDIPGSQVGIQMADCGDYDAPITVGSVQTLRPGRLCDLLSSSSLFGDDRPFVACMIDESHHVTGDNSYATLIEQIRAAYPECKFIGCTATPYRSDKFTMQDMLPTCTFSRSIPDMQAAGWLSPVTWSPIKIPLDLSRVKTSMTSEGKDFNPEQLEEQISPLSAYIAQKTAARLENRPMVVFCCSVNHAQELAQAYNQAGLVSFPVWGNMPKCDREEVLANWKAGLIQVVTNVGVLTEGFDYQPTQGHRHGLSAMVIARPTMSPSLYLQMLGRGTRLKPADSEYQDCLVMDVVGNANLLETKQITLPRVMPTLNEKEMELTGHERQSQQETRPHTLRINDPLSVSWIAWGYDDESGVYHTGLGKGHYAALIPDTSGSGLYQAYHYERDLDYRWSNEQIVSSAKPLAEMMQHVNHVIAMSGLKHLLDKEAKWRQTPASEKQLAVLKKMDRTAYQAAVNFAWTKGEVSQHLNWLFLRSQVMKTM